MVVHIVPAQTKMVLVIDSDGRYPLYLLIFTFISVNDGIVE